MSITQDDVGRVLDTYGEMYVKDDAIVKSEMPLVDFANHFYELGRQKQRESDAGICVHESEGGLNDGDKSWAECGEYCAEAIRNNTGELK